MKPYLNYYKFNSYNNMKILLFHIFFFISFSSANLYQVFAVSRHGARYHTRNFYDGNDTQPLWGQLTSVGMRQLYNLGILIRKQYVDYFKLLSPKYNKQEIQVYSTLVNRTIMSGSSFLYGLYPLDTGPTLPLADNHLHQPPYSNATDIELQKYSMPRNFQQIKVVSNETVILTDCPNYDKFKDINFEMISDIVNEMNITYFPFLKRMSTMFNFSLNSASLYMFTKCFDNAIVNNYLARPLPSNFTENDYVKLRYLTNWYYSVAMSQNNSLMDNTFKLQRLMNHFQLRMQYPKSYPLKWTHLFGHDTDIIALHLALNTTSADCIQQLHRKGTTKYTECEVGSFDFASNILVELHSQNEKDFFVKVRSNGRYLKICKQSYTCQYKEFKNLIQKSVSKISMDIICGIKIRKGQEGKKPTNNIVIE